MMGLFWNILARPAIALQDSEKAHSRGMFALKMVQAIPPFRLMMKILWKPKSTSCDFLDWSLSNPLGLAAGMDKKAENVMAWDSLGFGFIEVGGFTAVPQNGNPKPRMFRNSQHKALINRMGFNNPGSLMAAKTLEKISTKRMNSRMKVLANLGRSKTATNEEAPADYCESLRNLWPYVDGFVVNVSSPNTPGLRELQEGNALHNLLQSCIAEEEKCGGGKPILVKISPDLSDEQLDLVIDCAREVGCAAIVATNTTLARPEPSGKKSKSFTEQQGGLSGQPLNQRSTEVIAHIFKRCNGEWPIIGVGGIASAEDAWEKIIHGASCIQLYSALVFKGPGVIKEIVHGLERILKRNGFTSLTEAVGTAVDNGG